MKLQVHPEGRHVQIDAFRTVKHIDAGLKGNIRNRVVGETELVGRPLPHDTVAGPVPDVRKKAEMVILLPEEAGVVELHIADHEQGRLVLAAKRLQKLQLMEEPQGHLLMYIPFYIHGKMGLEIFRLQGVFHNFRKM